MYGGRPYVIDRVRSDEPLRIRHLSVGLLGGVQPDKLAALMTGPDDGLVSRVLWAWPDALPEFSLDRTFDSDVEARTAFARLANLAMGTDENGMPEPKRLRLDRDGEDALEEFSRRTATRAHDAVGPFAGALGKARGHALRLAAIVEHLWWCGTGSTPEPTRISLDALLAAGALMESYFLPMAERVYGDASIPAPEQAAMHVARYLRRTGRSEFNARDLRREIGGPVRQAKAMTAVCSLLEEAGLIRPRFQRDGSKAGRLARDFEVNPAVLEHTSTAATVSAPAAVPIVPLVPKTMRDGHFDTIGTIGARSHTDAGDFDQIREREALALDGDVPAVYAPAFAALQIRRPANMEDYRWQQAILDAGVFLDTWADEAERGGWTAEDLFGPNGLVLRLDGRRVLILTSERMILTDGCRFERHRDCAAERDNTASTLGAEFNGDLDG
jgi:hypothetical protein